MPTVPDTELIQFDNWTLRVRKTTHPTPCLLLLLHGFTGDENSMWVFARDLPSRYWMIAPRAPHPTEPFGYSWRPRANPQSKSHFNDLQPSAEALIQLVDAYQASAGIEAHVFDVMGFSQGAAMSSVLTLSYPDHIGRTCILAGFVPNGVDELIARQTLRDKPFFITHGTKDDMVSIDRARASLKLLEGAGAKITYCEDEIGHKVSIHCLHALRTFFAS